MTALSNFDRVFGTQDNKQGNQLPPNPPAPNASSPAPEGTPGKPWLELTRNGRSASVFASELGALLKPNPIFLRNGDVVCLEDKKFTPISSTSFVTWVEQFIVLFKWEGKEHPIQQPHSMSESLAGTCMASSQFKEQLRVIRRDNPVRMPVIRSSGALELLPYGYDEESKCFTHEGVSFPESMSWEQGEAHLRDLLGEFAWPEGDQEVALSKSIAMMLAVFADMLIPKEEVRPVFIVIANRAGAGKTNLVRCAICPTHGSVRTNPPDQKTMRQLLLSKVISGSPYLFLDNWRGEIADPSLECFITTSNFEDRQLGVSKMAGGDKECIVFITGNRARMKEDMRRRSIVIELEIEELMSENRKIKNPMSESGILRRRSEILGSLWALIRLWDGQARPSGTIDHQSFSSWARTFGAIVECIGLPSPLTRPKQCSDESLRDMSILIESLAEEIIDPEAGAHFTSAELMEHARDRGLFSWVIAEERPADDRSLRHERSAFSAICTNYNKGLFGDFKFCHNGKVRRGTSGATNQFRIWKPSKKD
jgi:hypothetical protein